MFEVKHYGLKSIKYLKEELAQRDLLSGNAPYLIRWGTRKKFGEYKIEVNEKEKIKNASNKLRSIELFHKNNIPCVASTSFEEIIFPCFVFKEKHAHGNGIVFLTSKYDYEDLISRIEFNKLAYWSPLLPIKQEYRAHVCNRNVLLLRKIFMGDKVGELEYNKNIKPFSYVVRNRKNGYVFYSVKKWSKVHDRLCKIAINVINSLGLVFGAVDLATYNIEGEIKSGINVFEVNSGPSLSPRTAKFYVDNLVKYVEENQ